MYFLEIRGTFDFNALVQEDTIKTNVKAVLIPQLFDK